MKGESSFTISTPNISNNGKVLSVLDTNDAKLTDRDDASPVKDDGDEESSSHDPKDAVSETCFEPLTLDQYLEDYAESDVNGDYSFTGVWHSAKGLLDYLLRNRRDVGSVLEIGAGTGWLGITVAHRLKELCREVLLTDRTDFWLRANLEEARKQGIPCLQVSCQAMDWSNTPQVQSVARKKWDYVIGSDLIYSEEGLQILAQTVEVFARSRSGTILYAHTLGRMPELDKRWEQELHARGLTWDICATLPVMISENEAWEGRHTVIMNIYAR